MSRQVGDARSSKLVMSSVVSTFFPALGALALHCELFWL